MDVSAAAVFLLTVCFCFFMSSAGAENIRAVVGEKVTLTCKVNNNNRVTVVEWIRPDLKPDQVLLYRDNKFHPIYQHPSFKNRVDLLDLQKGDVSLILRNLKISDSGTYECHVVQEGTNRNKRDADLICTIILSVVPAGAENITAVVGKKVTLTCKVLNNNRVTVVEWTRPDLDPDHVLFYRKKKFLPDYQHPSFQNRVDLLDPQKGDVSLILKNLKINDNGTYECYVEQEGTNRNKRAADLICTIKLSVVSAGDKDEVKEEEEDSSSHSGIYWTVALVVTAVLVVLVAVVVFLTLKRIKKNSSRCRDEPADVDVNPLNHDDTIKQPVPS